jgi:hypothetical protein
MWGTSYADLAKRAQELQEQAALAANTLSVRLTFVVQYGYLHYVHASLYQLKRVL